MRLKDKVCIITGAAQGIGHATAEKLTAEGATFDEEGLLRLLRLARIGCDQIFEAQRKATGR